METDAVAYKRPYLPNQLHISMHDNTRPLPPPSIYTVT